MRPLRLEFSGLNSYRSRQVVDFERLGEGGLFGIFGPTGSGKSSILDAITLALYGSVDRASNNTRGIINQLEKALDASFQFELGGDGYQVDRRYERKSKDSDSAESKQARLLKLGSSGEEVLASNPREVSAKVQEILGISLEEFSRAVVLPQGKFDQFLRLKGSERAEMLEHIFNLEEYGDELVEKVKTVSVACREQLNRITGEEQGLGDCSEETINQALCDWQTKSTELTGIQTAFVAADSALAEARALQGLHQAREKVVEKRNQLEEQRPTVDEKEARLAAAEGAEPLREPINRQRDLAVAIKLQTTKLENQEKILAEADTRHGEAEAKLKHAENACNELLPELHAKRTQLQGALEKDGKLRELKATIKRKRNELGEIITRIGAIEEEMTVSQNELAKTRVELVPLAERRTKLKVDLEEKEAVEQAWEALIDLEDKEKRLNDRSETLTRHKAHLDGCWSEITKIISEQLPERTIEPGKDIEKLAKSLEENAQADLDSARAVHQQVLIENSALALAKELHAGEPCPVCGSKEHPQPAQITADEIDKCEQAVKKAESRSEEIKNWQDSLLKLWHDWSSNEPHAKEAQSELEKAQAGAALALEAFEKVSGQYDRANLRQRRLDLAESENSLRTLEKGRDTLLVKQEELQGKVQATTEQSQTEKVNAARIKETLLNQQTLIDASEAELSEITGGKELAALIQETDATIIELQQAVELAKQVDADTRAALEEAGQAVTILRTMLQANKKDLDEINERLATGLRETGFATVEQAETAILSAQDKQLIRDEVGAHRQAMAIIHNELAGLDQEIGGRPFDDVRFEQIQTKQKELHDTLQLLKEQVILAKNKADELKEKQTRWRELQQQKVTAEKRNSLSESLANLLRGRKFVSFLAQEHLRDMARDASGELGRLTSQRYALEVTNDKDCEFVIRDDYHGGNRRTVSSLSGGEAFLTSLALALALSSKIQLRGKFPLGFFFLDEGFGSLDEEKLDKVIDALEKLHNRDRMVGVISHVKELRERLPRYLEVVAAGEDGRGSEIRSTTA